MAHPSPPKVAAAHVNMMTDTIIQNMTADGMRSIMRSLLALRPELTPAFEAETRKYIREFALPAAARAPATVDATTPWLDATQRTVRCMLGCGLCYEALPLAYRLAEQALDAARRGPDGNNDKSAAAQRLAAIDGDLVQAVTAVQKSLMVPMGTRQLTNAERARVRGLHEVLVREQQQPLPPSVEYPYSRALAATAGLLGDSIGAAAPGERTIELGETGAPPPPPPAAPETFALNDRALPRVFSGLWQLSSPAWGAAPASEMVAQFLRHVQGGLTAFDMADHYGDAEVIFGRFRAAYPHKRALFAATKYCVFHPLQVTREAMAAAVFERCTRLQVPRVDLLQFHWQFYEDTQYLEALRYIAEDERVEAVGLCNFDTKHMERVIKNEIKVHSNQFSLIDSRPTVQMGALCEMHGVKLLTYGTLCGGFLAEKWLDKAEPGLYEDSITPSQRKYQSMIRSWGDWTLFQELLGTLKEIGLKHHVSVSSVATRWVLDFPYVGAVIVGARMGISEHTDDNRASLGWSLDAADRKALEQVLQKSRRREMFESMGDCGGEYR